MRRLAALALAALTASCGDTAHRPIPGGAPQPRVPASLPVPGPPPTPTSATLEGLESAGLPPVGMSASAVEGHAPLPTYAAKIRNLSDRPVRRVVATVVYLDAAGRAMEGENHDVAFGSPLKAIDPGGTLETSFLSRVERAPGVRLVARTVTFLEQGGGAEAVPREWTNPRYAKELAEAGRP